MTRWDAVVYDYGLPEDFDLPSNPPTFSDAED